MTSKERLTRLFNGEEIDRIPIWLLAPYHQLSYYADIYNEPSYKKVSEYIQKYCDTFDRRNYDFGFCRNANPQIKRSPFFEETGGNTIRGEIISYKDFSLKRFISRGKDGTKVKYFVEDADDLQKILEIPYTAGKPNLSSYFKEREELGDKGLMMSDIGDPLSSLYSLMSAENFSILTLVDEERLFEFLDEMHKRAMDNYKYLLENNIGDVFFLVGAEFAGPPLVSPGKFNDICVRYVKNIVDLIREYEKKSIVHYHGNLYNVLEGIRTINPDGLHTIEAPPVGDCTITQAREILGREMVLIGNIQYDDIVHRESAEIDIMVRDAISEGRNGRFILSPSAGPYEKRISEKTSDNYISFIESGLKYGKFERFARHKT